MERSLLVSERDLGGIIVERRTIFVDTDIL